MHRILQRPPLRRSVDQPPFDANHASASDVAQFTQITFQLQRPMKLCGAQQHVRPAIGMQVSYKVRGCKKRTRISWLRRGRVLTLRTAQHNHLRCQKMSPN